MRVAEFYSVQTLVRFFGVLVKQSPVHVCRAWGTALVVTGVGKFRLTSVNRPGVTVVTCSRY